MSSTLTRYFDELRETRVWRSVFRGGVGQSTLANSMAIQQNVFLHLLSTKVRRRMLEFNATWYLGTLTLGTFGILVITGILLMLYYHPSVRRTRWCFWCLRTCFVCFIAERIARRVSLTG